MSAVLEAQEAERRLAEIARTRRPTQMERAIALAAYEAARLELRLACPDCDSDGAHHPNCPSRTLDEQSDRLDWEGR